MFKLTGQRLAKGFLFWFVRDVNTSKATWKLEQKGSFSLDVTIYLTVL